MRKFSTLLGILVTVWSVESRAQFTGMMGDCDCGDGTTGTKDCIFFQCRCLFCANNFVGSCTTSCGTPGETSGSGACFGPEVCNGCDDDGDNLIDDMPPGMKCNDLPLAPAVCAPVSFSCTSNSSCPSGLSCVAGTCRRSFPIRLDSFVIAGGATSRSMMPSVLTSSYPVPAADVRYIATTVPLHWKVKLSNSADDPQFFLTSNLAPGSTITVTGNNTLVGSLHEVNNTIVPLPLARPSPPVPVPAETAWSLVSSSGDQPLVAAGFTIESVAVGCGPAASTITDLEEDEPVLGILVARGDTHEYRIRSSASNSGKWLVGVFALDGAFDIDMYANSGSPPTKFPNTVQLRSVSTQSSEALAVNVPAAGADMFVSVQSGGNPAQAPAGAYILVAYRPRVTLALRAGFDFKTTEDDVSAARQVLSRAQRGWYSLLGGRVQFTGSKVFPNLSNGPCTCGGSACDICFKESNGRSSATIPFFGGQSTLFKEGGVWVATVLAHEIGHSEFGLLDEYRDHNAPDGTGPASLCHGDDGCSHSFMSNYISWSLCRAENHGKSVFPFSHYTAGSGNAFPSSCAEANVTKRLSGPGQWEAFPASWRRSDRRAPTINTVDVPAFVEFSTVEVMP